VRNRLAGGVADGHVTLTETTGNIWTLDTTKK